MQIDRDKNTKLTQCRPGLVGKSTGQMICKENCVEQAEKNWGVERNHVEQVKWHCGVGRVQCPEEIKECRDRAICKQSKRELWFLVTLFVEKSWSQNHPLWMAIINQRRSKEEHFDILISNILPSVFLCDHCTLTFPIWCLIIFYFHIISISLMVVIASDRNRETSGL